MTKKRNPIHQANMIKAQQGRKGTARGSLSDSRWRAACLARDTYTCQLCKVTQKQLNEKFPNGGMSSYLQVHHIKPREEFPEFEFDISNGIVYCPPCHSKVETYEHRRNVIIVVDSLLELVNDLTASYGITDSSNDELIALVNEALFDLSRVVRLKSLKAAHAIAELKTLPGYKEKRKIHGPKQTQKYAFITIPSSFTKYPSIPVWFNKYGKETHPFLGALNESTGSGS